MGMVPDDLLLWHLVRSGRSDGEIGLQGLRGLLLPCYGHCERRLKPVNGPLPVVAAAESPLGDHLVLVAAEQTSEAGPAGAVRPPLLRVVFYPEGVVVGKLLQIGWSGSPRAGPPA